MRIPYSFHRTLSPSRYAFSSAAATVLVALLLCTNVRGQEVEDIKVPFGFHWGESSERLEKMLQQSKARVVSKSLQDGRTVIEATGIPQPLLLRSFFFFENDSLVEIELHYGDPTWPGSRYTEYFDQSRRHIDRRYGPGRLIARTRSNERGTAHSLIGYQWARPSTTLQIFLFTAERGSEHIRVLSLHYTSS
jgi:hypothetical protein